MRPESVQPGLGPQRTIFAATPGGRQAAEDWLDTPVAHVRDIRSHLLLKLALLDRAGADPADLLRRQRAVLEPIARAIESGSAARGGFDATLLAWRRATAAAALEFLDAITQRESQPGSRHFIGGQWADAASGKTFETPNPPPARRSPGSPRAMPRTSTGRSGPRARRSTGRGAG